MQMPDPVAFHIGSLAVYWYGICVAAGFMAGYAYLLKRGRKMGVSEEASSDLVFAAACSGGGSKQSPVSGGPDVADSTTRKSWAGKDPAPAIPTGVTWFNVQKPLTLSELKGRMVLLDFWTLGCINCQHIIPDLVAYKDVDLVIPPHLQKMAIAAE